jgi:hypothetical protein
MPGTRIRDGRWVVANGINTATDSLSVYGLAPSH